MIIQIFIAIQFRSISCSFTTTKHNVNVNRNFHTARVVTLTTFHMARVVNESLDDGLSTQVKIHASDTESASLFRYKREMEPPPYLDQLEYLVAIPGQRTLPRSLVTTLKIIFEILQLSLKQKQIFSGSFFTCVYFRVLQFQLSSSFNLVPL